MMVYGRIQSVSWFKRPSASSSAQMMNGRPCRARKKENEKRLQLTVENGNVPGVRASMTVVLDGNAATATNGIALTVLSERNRSKGQTEALREARNDLLCCERELYDAVQELDSTQEPSG